MVRVLSWHIPQYHKWLHNCTGASVCALNRESTVEGGFSQVGDEHEDPGEDPQVEAARCISQQEGILLSRGGHAFAR